MKYSDIKEGRFISRPNRFIAIVEIEGEECICHVKNTGRCRELLLRGVKVILERSSNPERKTLYDLVAVYKGDKLINIDSQAPNKVLGEWLLNGGFFEGITLIAPERKYKNSRFDFYIERGDKKAFIEVKGVTLEENGRVLFPDAPTERGVKHLRELIEVVGEGMEAYVFFVVQMKDCHTFSPNSGTHPEFASALKEAQDSGVKIYALNCNVTEDGLWIDGFIDTVI